MPKLCGNGTRSAAAAGLDARTNDGNIVHIYPAGTGAIERQILRVQTARKQIAQQIVCGEDWLIPLLKRFNAEIEALEEKQDLLVQAAQIANQSA